MEKAASVIQEFKFFTKMQKRLDKSALHFKLMGANLMPPLFTGQFANRTDKTNEQKINGRFY